LFSFGFHNAFTHGFVIHFVESTYDYRQILFLLKPWSIDDPTNQTAG
jgi:hypothetical protein